MNEETIATSPPTTIHTYQYKCPACENTDWQDATVTYTDEDWHGYYYWY